MSAYINGISYYLPANILSNEDIIQEHPEWSVDEIARKTGILNRHISDTDESSGDMAFNALTNFFGEYNIDKNQIDFLLLCTQSPDYLLPTTACILQDRMKLPKTCGALDFNLGCSGYIYGLGLAKGLIESNQAKNVLLVTSEMYSKFIHHNDKSNKTLFGDAATVTLISAESVKNFSAEIKNFVYGTDGSGFEYLIVKNSAMKKKSNDSQDEYDEDNNFFKNDNNLYMDGKAIFDFTAFEIPPLINKTLLKNHIEIDNVDLFIFHQANAYMLDFIRSRCKIPKEKFYISLANTGNTVSSTIPIALKQAINAGLIKNPNNKILLAGFGVGLSMGAVVIQTES